MKRDMEMYTHRHNLLRSFIARDIRAAIALKLIEPMKTMSEAEKEDFAKDLRLRLERGEIDLS